MAENKPKSSEELIKQALDYATGSNSLENHILTVEELKQIERDVNAGKGDRSFLMAVLEYVRIKKAEQQALASEGVSCGRLKK